MDVLSNFGRQLIGRPTRAGVRNLRFARHGEATEPVDGLPRIAGSRLTSRRQKILASTSLLNDTLDSS